MSSRDDALAARGGTLPLIARALQRLAAEHPLRLAVRGDCMSPSLRNDQSVQVTAATWYWPGDVVAFPEAERLVVHRVIGYRLRRGRLRLQTRADATGTLDSPLPPHRVIGRVSISVSLTDRWRALHRFVRLRLTGRLPR